MGCSPFADSRFQMGVTVMGFAEHFGHRGFKVSKYRKTSNKAHPIRGLYRIFFEKFLFKFPFSHKRFQMGQKMYFYQLYKL